MELIFILSCVNSARFFNELSRNNLVFRGVAALSSDETWTPSALLAFDDSMQEFGLTLENVQGPVQVFNSCMDSLANAVGKPRIDPLQSQVACWENCSNADRSAAIQKAEEACQLMCDVIAPNDGKQLFQAIMDQQQNMRETGGAGIQALVVAYQKEPSKSQIHKHKF